MRSFQQLPGGDSFDGDGMQACQVPQALNLQASPSMPMTILGGQASFMSSPGGYTSGLGLQLPPNPQPQFGNFAQALPLSNMGPSQMPQRPEAPERGSQCGAPGAGGAGVMPNLGVMTPVWNPDGSQPVGGLGIMSGVSSQNQSDNLRLSGLPVSQMAEGQVSQGFNNSSQMQQMAILGGMPAQSQPGQLLGAFCAQLLGGTLPAPAGEGPVRPQPGNPPGSSFHKLPDFQDPVRQPWIQDLAREPLEPPREESQPQQNQLLLQQQQLILQQLAQPPSQSGCFGMGDQPQAQPMQMQLQQPQSQQLQMRPLPGPNTFQANLPDNFQELSGLQLHQERPGLEEKRLGGSSGPGGPGPLNFPPSICGGGRSPELGIFQQSREDSVAGNSVTNGLFMDDLHNPLDAGFPRRPEAGKGFNSELNGNFDLRVGVLGQGVNPGQIREIFRLKGLEIRSIDMQRLGKGMALVALADPSKARRAVDELNGFNIDGRILTVEFIDERAAVAGKGELRGFQPGGPQKGGGKPGFGKGSKESWDKGAAFVGTGPSSSSKGAEKGGDPGGGKKGPGKGKANNKGETGFTTSGVGKMRYGNSPNKLFIGNLSTEVSSDDLIEALKPAGEVLGIRLRQGKYSSIAFAEFKHPGCVDLAVRTLQGLAIKGRPARMEHQSSKNERMGEDEPGLESGGGPGKGPGGGKGGGRGKGRGGGDRSGDRNPAPRGILQPGPLPPGPMAGNLPPRLPSGMIAKPGEAAQPGSKPTPKVGLTPGIQL